VAFIDTGMNVAC